MRNIEIPTVTPQFYEALSGELAAPYETQTLGRLATETYLHGTRNDNAIGDFFVNYTPRWAQGIDITIAALKDSNRALIHSITVRNESNQRLHVVDQNARFANLRQVLISRHNANTRSMSTELGEDLDFTRHFITRCAQDIFDTAL